MFFLQDFWLTVRTRATTSLWLVAICVFLPMMSSALAQNTAITADGQVQQVQGQTPNILVKQTLWVDDSRQLDFESARTQVFQPFNPFERLIIGNKVVWLRLHIDRLEGEVGPLFLHLIPPHLGDVTLFSPSSDSAATWNERAVLSHELVTRIKMGEAKQGEEFYLRIASRNNAGIIAFVGSREELDLHETKLAVVMTFISTLMLVALLIFLWRTVRHFSWMSLLICGLLVSYQIYTWIGLGYAYTILGWPLERGINLITPNVIANFGTVGGILVLIACALFPNQRWLNWLWAWSVFQFSLFVYAFIEPSHASSLSMTVWLLGPLALAACLTVAAIREPTGLEPFSNKIAFLLLLLTCLLLQVIAFKSGGIVGSPADEPTTELFIKSILIRFPQLIVIIVLSSWLFERIQANHLEVLSGELKRSKESLEMESKRLERQRKFTAMLAHELKNPLAVSHLALSGIEARLGSNDPVLERAASIKQSLQDIDAIINRCSEIDGFEQGELPMRIGTFSLNHLLAVVKESNTNERIYFLKRGFHEDAMITSDIQYLKIILSNLLTNALKYSPADTLIEVSIQPLEHEGQSKLLRFSVSSEVGEAGTPEPSLAFERFYRAESARNQSGAGLGLWLSQALANSLNSEVVMQHDGKTISFSMKLPYA